jgi:hypothetical protein
VLAVRATALVARATEAIHRAAPPAESIDVREGHTRRDLASDAREYAFIVGIANRSQSERRLNGIALRVTYRTRANFVGAVDLPSEQAIVVPPGQASTVTLRFTTSNVIPRHSRIDAYTLLLRDDNGARMVVDASLPSVLEADTDGAGPVTWGWD